MSGNVGTTRDFNEIMNLASVGLCRKFSRGSGYPWLEVSGGGGLELRVQCGVYGQALGSYAASMRQPHNLNAWEFTYELIE
jgi:hypothetical protein